MRYHDLLKNFVSLTTFYMVVIHGCCPIQKLPGKGLFMTSLYKYFSLNRKQVNCNP